MILSLHDTDPDVVAAWTNRLARYEGITVSIGNILASGCDALVSPANSQGFMDGGVDLAYLRFFGLELQHRVQTLIAARFAGSIPVGEAMVVSTGHPRMSRMIVAPTMDRPRDISDTENVYLAVRAALACAVETSPAIARLGMPGMGTGIGRMDADESARQVERALIEVLGPRAMF